MLYMYSDYSTSCTLTNTLTYRYTMRWLFDMQGYFKEHDAEADILFRKLFP